MKLRLKGNTIRFRLSKQEVEILADSGVISEMIDFGANHFSYALEKSGDSDVFASFVEDTMLISIPVQVVDHWANSDEVGIVYEITNNSKKLKVLIEKDFACLKVRKDEDESDLFVNPDESKFKC